MALETQTRTIETCEIRCTPMKARDTARMLARLMKYAGAAMTELRKIDIAAIGVHRLLDFMAFVPTVSVLLAQMTPDEFDSITCALLARCNVIIRDDGVDPCKFDLSKPAEIDTAFAGKLGLMVKTLAYVLEVHYAGFFRDLVFGVGGAAPEQPTT